MVEQDYIHLSQVHQLLMQVAEVAEHGLDMYLDLLIIHMQEMGESVAAETEPMWTLV
jgi:uncharacterized protein (DUF952 family)